MTEAQLIKGCIENSRLAQKELFYLYYNEMVSLCCLYCKNQDDAKWVCNQGFMDVFTSIKSFKGDSQLRTWIRRLMINRAITFYNKEKTMNGRMQLRDHSHLMTIDVISIEESAIQRMEYEDIMKCVQMLPDKERMVFTMFIVEGFSHKEIAEMMEIAPGTCRWYLNNARRLLQEKLKEKENDERAKLVKNNFKTGI